MKLTYGGKTYEAEPAKHVKLPDGTVLKVVSTDGDIATVELAKKPGSVTDATTAVEVAEEKKAEQTATEPKVDPKLAASARISAAKLEWDAAQAEIAAAVAKQSAIEARIAADLIEVDKGRVRGTPPTPVTLGSKLFKAQKSRDGSGAVSLVPVPAVGQSL